jgi:hypothetical protein
MKRSWLVAPFLVALFCACSSSDETNTSDASTVDSSAGQTVILDGGGGIPDPPDGAAHCPQGTCNYQSQTGCSANMACLPSVKDGGLVPGCSPAGTVAADGACTSWTDCVAGTICANGACRTLCCDGDWRVCPTGEHCFSTLSIQLVDAGLTSSGAMICLPPDNCNVFDGSGCTTGKTCHLIDSTGATACIVGGKGVAGEDCPCAAGYTCAGGMCRKLCKAVLGGGDPACSDSDGICIHFDRDPAAVGECTP